MRVISGTKKGFKLVQPKSAKTRPTRQKVKEAVFDMLAVFGNFDVVLDVFAGSGALGIEALSRGSKFGIFVDNNNFSLYSIAQNLKHTNFQSQAKIIKRDAILFLKTINIKFNIIFIDPPYNKGYLKKSINEIYKRRLLLKNGLVVIESQSNGEELSFDYIECKKAKKYGTTAIHMYSMKD